MRVARWAAALLLAGFALPAAAEEQPPSPAPIEEWSHARVIALGEAIYRQDVAAWVSTDAMFAHLDGRPPPPGLAGWIVVDRGEDQLVRFVRDDDNVVRPVFDIPVRNGKAGPVTEVTSGQIVGEELAQFRARQTAINNVGPLICSRLNTVVLKDPESDDWLVWLLASSNQAGVVPIGGHYRFRISADGKSMIRRDQLSTSCLAMPPTTVGDVERAAIFVTHVVSSGPLETHVFLSLQNQLPIYVGVDGVLFEVNGRRVRTVDQQR